MPWRPPKQLLILGKPVLIRVVSKEEMRDVVADNDGALGAWDRDTSTIYLLKSMSPTERNRTFWHELQHCLIDFFDP